MFTHAIARSSRNHVRKCTLLIGGEATFDNEEEMHRTFSETLRGCDHLIVDIDKIEQADLSFVMLICSTHRTAELLKKRLTVKGVMPSASKWHFEYASESRKRGCLFSRRRHCLFWER